MVLLIFNDDCITGLPIDELRASHVTHQNQTQMGLHEETPCLQQEIGVAAVQTNLDTASGVPLCLKRKLLMHHEGMICSLLMGFANEVDRQTATDRTSRTSCNCNNKASEGNLAILGDSDTSTVSDDGDWMHSDYSDNGDGDEDEDEAQPQFGVGVGPSRDGKFPPRVRLLRRRYLLMNRHDDHDSKGTAALARPWQIYQDPPCSGRKRTDTETATVTSKDLYDRNCNNDHLDDESATTKRRRLGSESPRGCAPDIIRRVEAGLGELPADTDGAYEVAAPPTPIPGHLVYEASALALSVGRRRSQRIRKKLGSACGTSPSRRS
jgi:hypothetical protein